MFVNAEDHVSVPISIIYYHFIDPYHFNAAVNKKREYGFRILFFY